MNGDKYSSLSRNRAPFANVWRILAINRNFLLESESGGVSMIPYASGVTIVGQRNLKKKNPATAVCQYDSSPFYKMIYNRFTFGPSLPHIKPKKIADISKGSGNNFGGRQNSFKKLYIRKNLFETIKHLFFNLGIDSSLVDSGRFFSFNFLGSTSRISS